MILLEKHLNKGKYTNIDESLKLFISLSCNVSVAINDQVLKAKALEIASIDNITNFKASNGYLEKLKKKEIRSF